MRHLLKTLLISILIGLSLSSFASNPNFASATSTRSMGQAEATSSPDAEVQDVAEVQDLTNIQDQVNLKLTVNQMLKSLTQYYTVDSCTEFTAKDEEPYPSYDFYNEIWCAEFNPYHTSIKDLPDSVPIDVRNFTYPTKSNHITSTFGPRSYRYHYGTDIGLQRGDTIYACFDGEVRLVRYDRHGYGHYVLIRHNNNLETISAHLSKVLVKPNQVVKSGDPIGLGGSSGRSTGPHLHFEMRLLGNAFNTQKLVDYAHKGLFYETTYIATKKDTYSHSKYLAAMKRAAYHKVRSGNTLSGIAHRYHTSVSRLCKLNHIKRTSILHLGQRIRYR